MKPRTMFPVCYCVPRSHICPSCLAELARIRAVPDPHYGLPIVVCPKCDLACVRTKHPDQIFWRRVRHTIHSIRLLLLAIIFTVLAVGATIGMAIQLTPTLTSRRAGYVMPDLADPDVYIAVIVACLIVLMCGCVIRAVYAHHHYWVAWLIYMLPASFFISIDYSMGSLLQQLARITGFDLSLTIPSPTEVTRRYESLFVLAFLATAGMLVGSLLTGMIKRSSGKRIVKLRRKLRNRQARQD